MRVFACIDAPGNGLTTTREVPISVHLRRPVPPAPACRGAGRGSVAKVLPLLLPLSLPLLLPLSLPLLLPLSLPLLLPLSLLLPLLLPLLVAKGQELRAGLLLFEISCVQWGRNYRPTDSRCRNHGQRLRRRGQRPFCPLQ